MFWLQENLILMKEMFNWLDVHNFLKNTYLNQKYHLFKSLEYFFKREATLVKITLGESHLNRIVETISELNISLLPCQINCSQVLALNTTLIEILWSDLTYKQQSFRIYRSAGIPVLLLSTLFYSEVALECLQSSKSRNFVA